MTRDQFFSKLNELITEHVETEIHLKANQVINSSVVDLNDYDDDYRLPKIVFGAALKSLAADFTPFYEEGKKALKEIETII